MNQNNAARPVLTDDEIMRSAINASDSLNITRLHEMGAPSRTIMDDAGLLELGRAIESALLSKLRAPVAKPRRAPLDDWRVQAIADCLETEWDEMSPDLAEAYARTIVGYLIEYEKESDRIEAKHASEPVEPIVQAIRNLRASAPVADTPRVDALTAQWDDDGATRGAAFIELRDLARSLEQRNDAILAAISVAKESLFSQCCSNPIKTAWGKQIDLTKLNALFDLASAPVAVEAQTVAWKVYDAGLNKHMLTDNPKVAEMLREEGGGNVVRPLVYGDASPQASEAVDRSPIMQGSQVDKSADLQGDRDIAQRLRDNAELDASEGGNPQVIALELEAAAEIDRLRAALSAQPGKQSSPWQPIETAPKDDVILLFGGLKKDGKVYAPHVNVGYWTEQFGWTCLVYSHQEFAHIEPTHWMPRPAFPKQHNDGGADE